MFISKEYILEMCGKTHGLKKSVSNVVGKLKKKSRFEKYKEKLAKHRKKMQKVKGKIKEEL